MKRVKLCGMLARSVLRLDKPTASFACERGAVGGIWDQQRDG